MSILDLWLPMLAATFACFFMSSAIWVLFKWHNSDYRRTEREDDVRAALQGSKPGYYMLPFCIDYAEMAKDEMQQLPTASPLSPRASGSAGPGR